MFPVKQLMRIIKAIPAILFRIAHVIEHIFCDEVPDVNFDDEEDDI